MSEFLSAEKKTTKKTRPKKEDDGNKEILEIRVGLPKNVAKSLKLIIESNIPRYTNSKAKGMLLALETVDEYFQKEFKRWDLN